ncbi:DUF3179 domain-containing (seleno)protein [Halorubrum sp. DTA98]|uniref:DUF3179 domain-containing (seleno)protein n=1 Tax=Halorubrum sp. DTA98 TaxID=3402163 RepID=UPI003AADB606
MTTDTRRAATEGLLVRDVDAHAEAVETLAREGDDRVVPHLLDVLVVDAIATDWERFGFPETMRSHDPPRYLELPDVRWPGVTDALEALTGERFDSDHAWVEWETWYSQREFEPLDGYDEWKRRLYNTYLPPVGALLDTDPIAFDLRDLRWGNCDPSFLAALNEPTLVDPERIGGDDETTGAGGTESATATLDDDDTVFGIRVQGVPIAVPRWLLFPHELLNVTVDGVPLSLTFCTLCNAPICYDRRVGDDVLTFGNSGMLLEGNKVMYDEETRTLWSQHRGVPIGGTLVGSERSLSVVPVSQTTWAEWRNEHPDTVVPTTDTGYGYDYGRYKGDLGIFRHYWDGSAIQPGVSTAESELDEKAAVYGVESGDAALAFPIDRVTDAGPIVGSLDGREYVAVETDVGDVGVFEWPTDAPPATAIREGRVIDADGTPWTFGDEGLTGGTRHAPMVPAKRGLWFAFRLGYEEATVAE